MEKEGSEFALFGKQAQKLFMSTDRASVTISDEILEQFLQINMNHMKLKRGKDQDEDVSLISWMANKKFICAISIFHKVGIININNPVVLPYISNIVNEHSPRLQPQNFKGVLFPPQAALVKKMLDIETIPIVFNVSNDRKIIYNGGIVNERLSFGKTFCIPALISHKPSIGQTIPVTSLTSSIYDNTVCTNLVVCGTKVAKEWKNNLNNFTSLTHNTIERANHLDELATLLEKYEYPQVLVVKDGDITWKGKKDKALAHVFDLFEGKTFMRVFFDDYDMLNLRDVVSPIALFTWFISGTDDKPFAGLKFYSWNEEGVKIPQKMESSKIILDAVSSVSCNKEYSTVEYNVPRIDEYYYNSDNLCEFICKIVNNKPIDELVSNDSKEDIVVSDRLLTGTRNVPYVYDKSTLKMLVAMEDKNSQKSLVSALVNIGIETIKLTRANINKFAASNATVCVCGNLFGVNLPFLTHIVICVNDFTSNACTQIIGRGQRLSRKQNLQVYMFEGI